MPYGRLAKHEIPSSCLPLLPLDYHNAAASLIFDRPNCDLFFCESQQTIPVVCHTRHITLGWQREICPRTSALKNTLHAEVTLGPCTPATDKVEDQSKEMIFL